MEKHHPPQSTNLCSPTSSPTTFVQADTNTFRDLVQKLTGLSGDSEKLPVTHPTRHYPKAPTIPGDPTGPRRSPFKLQERRHTMRKLEIKLSLANLHGSQSQTPRQTYQLLDSPIPSPVTPLGSDSLFFPSSGSESPSSPAAAASEEEKAISEKGFYLHPSPLSTPRGSDPPELLTLFPLSSPGHHDNKSQQHS
ncbi:PREDICTED: VQ [Prunus dulcis]|uniref:PREDICTED: VQ n=1 Tax=Prunus dulcis TaxID=3755 RepID=A0A5E4E9X1_PRUDU|nr:VQ motif-containing protein 31-like [Prunus dulcis]VVA11640.1 PREDICTED: VQ [Prunus dulcis]